MVLTIARWPYSKLDAAIINREEGVMIKDTKSKYVPNERKDSVRRIRVTSERVSQARLMPVLQWVKLKPEYIEGIADELDLLIIGTLTSRMLSSSCCEC